MNRSWVRFPQAAQIRPPGTGWAFLYALLVACCLWPRWCSGRRRARPPARLGDLTSFGAAPRSPPVPSGPSGALHTSGARSLIGGSARRLVVRPCPAAAHGHRSQAHQSLRHRASNPSRAPRPGPVDQAARLSETPIAFARACLRGFETAVTFAGAGRASPETPVAFAGEQRAFLVHFSVAVVMPVSAVPCWGRALVLLVSMSPRCRALCAKKFALLRLMVGVSATKFAQRAQNGPNSAFLHLLGEVFRGNATVGVVLGELFRANRYGVQVLDAMRCTSGWLRWGFCAMRSPLAACRRSVGGLDGVIPPDWWR